MIKSSQEEGMQMATAMTLDKNPMDRFTVIFAALMGSALGALFYNVLPMYLGMAQEYRQLTSSQIGFLGSVFFVGYNVSTISAFYWIRRFNWRVIAAIATPISAVAMGAGAYLQSYPMLLFSVFIAGGAFSTIYGLTATVLGDTSNAARWYGLKIGLEALTGAVIFLTFPDLVIAKHGFDGFLLALAAVVVLLSLPLFFLPAKGIKTQEEELAESAGGKGGSTNKAAVFSILFATMFWFCGQTVMWAFVERIGNAGGHPVDAVGTVLAVSLLCAFSGSILAAIIGGKLGTLAPFVIASGIFLTSLPVLNNSGEFPFFFAGACMVMFSVGFGIPYCFTITAELDNDGRYIILVVSAIGIGAMIAPAMAGVLFSKDNSVPVLVFGATVVLISIVLAAASNHFAKSKLEVAG
jgi:predicted MFS family arabinose efflux permease